MKKLAQKAGFIVEDGQIDWASDYTKELKRFKKLVVKSTTKKLKRKLKIK